MIRGEEAGLEASFADGWFSMSVCVAVGADDDSGSVDRIFDMISSVAFGLSSSI